jgi:hypothetical protein
LVVGGWQDEMARGRCQREDGGDGAREWRGEGLGELGGVGDDRERSTIVPGLQWAMLVFETPLYGPGRPPVGRGGLGR